MFKYQMKIGGALPLGEGLTGLERVLNGFNQWDGWGKVMLCQEKLDGWYGIAIKDADGRIEWEEKWDRYSELSVMLGNLNQFFPNDSIICGEVGHGTNAESEYAEANGFHRFIIFDCIRLNGVDMTEWRAIDRLETIAEYWKSNQKMKEIQFVDGAVLNGSPEVNKQRASEMFREIYLNGGEGIVLKDASAKYEPGTRTKSQWKIKKYVTKDYVVTGFHETESEDLKSRGMKVGSIECGLYINGQLKYVTRAGGFGHEWRKEFTDSPEGYIGRVVELGGYELFKSGALRHPCFLRFRDDRKPEDCIIDEGGQK